MQKIILVGGGGHCRSVIDVIEEEKRYEIVGIVDKKELIGTKIFGYEVIGCDDDLKNLIKKTSNAIVTVGQIKSNTIRVRLFKLLKQLGYTLPSIISPLAYVSKYAFIDEGSVIMHDVLVNANVKVGKNCIINSKALLEHDVVVKDNSHISTASVLNGGVVVEQDTFVGSGAIIKEGVEVSGFIKAKELVI